jgi:signal transduction histidine kinase
MLKKVVSLFLFLLLYASAYSQHSLLQQSDSAKRKAASQSKNDIAYISTCFFIAEFYMGKDMYDTAQIWLNEIAARLPLRKPSLFNFYLSINQSETYYYSGLKQMDLQESERALSIAKALNDSICLATGYNFVGLGYMNVDSVAKGVPFLKEGIRYARQPPYPPQYLSASKPHHLYGNLAEAYYKLNQFDSALIYAQKSLRAATEIFWHRGIAVANNLLGLVYAKKNDLPTAIQFQQKAIEVGLANNQPDVSLIAYGAVANCYEALAQPATAFNFLKLDFQLIEKEPTINSLFKQQFLGEAIVLCKKINNNELLQQALEQKTELLNQLLKKSDVQINNLVKASVINETRAAQLEVVEAKQRQSIANKWLIIALLALSSVVVLFIVYRVNQKRQLREVAMRNTISQDLHDDIGATISSIKLYSELANSVHESKPGQSKEIIEKITEQSKDIMSRMGDVIWSLKPAAEEKNSIATKLKNYSVDLLAMKGIVCHFDIDETGTNKISNPVLRNNILLIVKETMNNVAKYSEARNCFIALKKEKDLRLTIQDDGKGFDKNKLTGGNGLGNIEQRCKQLNGNCTITTAPGEGVIITCSFPIATISYTG